MKKNKKNKKRLKFIIPSIITLIMLAGIIFCYINVLPVSKQSDKVTLKIDRGSSIISISDKLKEEGLIRSKYFLLAYIKINNITNIKAGNYMLNKNMKPKKILSILVKGSNIKDNENSITFPEGKNMRKIAKIIDENTTNNYDDVFNLLRDKEYINSLIKEYWFLDDSILSEDIYYPLEGYLSPNTYNFKPDASVKDIFKKMLDQTDTILTKYKSQLQNSNLTPHQVITLASMVESEGVSLDDRKNIAGVFINRINNKMSLGSDVTTYYAAKVEMGERDLYKSEINSDNKYNTRSSKNAGKLPVGPVCNPSSDSIDAVINYTPNEYLYFVADKNMKVYFTKTDSEHNKIISELEKSGLWYEY